MLAEKERENLEKLFLKSNEKDIFAKIQEKHSVKFFLGNILQEESFIKKGILEVLPLALKYNKVYVFNETWKKITRLKDSNNQKEIYQNITKEVLLTSEKDSEILKIVSNKVPLSLNDLNLSNLSLVIKEGKTDNFIFFLEKRRLKKHDDLKNYGNDLVKIGFIYNDYDFLNYLNKRDVDLFGENKIELKNAAILGKIEKLNYLYSINPISFKDCINWEKEDNQPSEMAEKWLKSIELKDKLSVKLEDKKTEKTKTVKI